MKTKYEPKVKGKKMRYREDPDDSTSNEEIKRQREEIKNKPHKKPRNPDAIMKSGELLKDQNAKKSRSDRKQEAKKKIEDQIFDAYKDPVDGNFYLQVNPDDLDNFSMEELEVLNT